MDAAPKLEVFLGQDETYSRRQTSSLALPHQASQPPHNDQYEISGLTRIFHTDLLRRPGSQMDPALDSHCDLGGMYPYSPASKCSSALPHQASQSPRHDQYEISGLNIPYNDSERHLTVLGRSQATAMGAFCHKFQVKPQIILTSPFSRALETMYLVQQKIDMPP